MKTLVIAISTIIGLAFSQANETSIELEQAIKSKTVVASFNGVSGSTHYLKPLQATIQNVKNVPLTIKVPAGYHFVSTDSSVQDIVTTQEELLVLGPKEKLQVNLSGMCIQHHNISPGADDAFVFGGWANARLRKMAAFLDEKDIQSCQGQQAMWTISDGESVANLIYNSLDGNRELLDATCDIIGKPRYTDDEFKKLSKDSFNPIYKAELRGKFSFKFSRKVDIHIALFDQNGIVLKEIYKESATPGRHNVEYSFDALPYQGQTIHAKLIAFNDVLIDRVIEL